MRLPHIAALASAAIVLQACASVQTAAPTRETGSFPAIGDRTTVAVGQVIATRYDFAARSTAVVLESVDSSFWAGRQGVATGTALELAMASGEVVYCKVGRGYSSPCLKDTDADNHFDRAGTINLYGMLVNDRRIDPVPYRLSNQNILDGFKYELIYQGVDTGVARIAYREYFANLARPDYAQDLTYTLATEDDTAARFRDVELTIHAADNSTITYTVNAGFGGAP